MEQGYEILQTPCANMQLRVPVPGPPPPAVADSPPVPAREAALQELTRTAVEQVSLTALADMVTGRAHRDPMAGPLTTMQERIRREVTYQVRAQFMDLVQTELPPMAERMSRDWLGRVFIENPQETKRMVEVITEQLTRYTNVFPQVVPARGIFDEVVEMVAESRTVMVRNVAIPPVSTREFRVLRVRMSTPMGYPVPYGVVRQIASRAWHAAISHRSPLGSFEGFAVLLRQNADSHTVYYWQIPVEYELDVDCLWKSGGWSVRTMAGTEKWVQDSFAAIDTFGSQTLFRVEELKDAREWLGTAHEDAVKKVKRGIWDELRVHFTLGSLTSARAMQEEEWGSRPRHSTLQTKLFGEDGKTYLWLATDYSADRGFFLEPHFPDDPWLTQPTDRAARNIRSIVESAYENDPW